MKIATELSTTYAKLVHLSRFANAAQEYAKLHKKDQKYVENIVNAKLITIIEEAGINLIGEVPTEVWEILYGSEHILEEVQKLEDTIYQKTEGKK